MIVQQDVFVFFLGLGFKRGGGFYYFSSSYLYYSGTITDTGAGVSIYLFDVMVKTDTVLKSTSCSTVTGLRARFCGFDDPMLIAAAFGACYEEDPELEADLLILVNPNRLGLLSDSLLH